MNWLVLIGLLLGIAGAAIGIKGALTTSAAIIKQRWTDIEESWKKQRPTWFQRCSCHIAKAFGSDDPQDTDDYATETFKANFWAFVLLLLSFLFQTVAILANLGLFGCDE